MTVEFPEYAFAVSEEHVALYRERVVRGRQRMRASRVVIAGLVRNAIDVLPATIERVERLCAAFADFRVVVYENDSIDGTRELLAAWAAGVSKVTAVSDVLSSPVNPKTRCNERGERMADCRNRYRDLVAEQI